MDFRKPINEGALVRKTGPVRLIDVAKAAGVSKSTASRALLNTGRVSEKTKAHVQAVAARLGYVRDQRAAELHRQHNGVIGMLIRGADYAFYSQMVAEVQREIDKHGLTLLIVNGGNTYTEQKRALTTLAERRVDGIIIASGRAKVNAIKEIATVVPSVIIGLDVILPNVDTVVIAHDSESILVDHVAAFGHQRVAVTKVPESQSYTLALRFERMRQALEKHGITCVPLDLNTDESINEDKIMHAINNNVTTIMAGDDMQMLAVLELLRSENIVIPGEVSVTGFDGVGQFSTPLLGFTTMRQPVKQLAKAAVNCLKDRISDPEQPMQYISFPGTMVPGRSLGLAPVY